MEPRRKKMRMTLRSDSVKPAIQALLKLPKLPYLAQINLIKMMTPSEQYLLSKCSKRTCQMVKNSMPTKNNHEIWVKFVTVAVYFYLKKAENIMMIHESLGEFSPEEHRYNCDLFRAPPKVYAIWHEGRWGHNQMKKYSEQHPDQELVLLHGIHAKGLDRDHTFLHARNLMFSSIGGFSPFSVLSLFQGKHLLMEDVLICKFFIEVFVDSWIKKSNDRLKSVILKLDPEAVIGNFKYEKFSENDRKFPYDSLIKDYHKFPMGIFDCSEGYEIRRKTDGKVATIKIIRDYFLFLIW